MAGISRLARAERDRMIARGMKKCSGCKEIKPLSEFGESKGKQDGYNTYCKTCFARVLSKTYYRHHEANKEYHREWKRKLVLAVKEGKACAMCGESHPACLDFHHRDPNGKEGLVLEMIKRPGKYSIEEIEAEIAKCDVLCANCHRKVHWESPSLTAHETNEEKLEAALSPDLMDRLL